MHENDWGIQWEVRIPEIIGVGAMQTLDFFSMEPKKWRFGAWKMSFLSKKGWFFGEPAVHFQECSYFSQGFDLQLFRILKVLNEVRLLHGDWLSQR